LLAVTFAIRSEAGTARCNAANSPTRRASCCRTSSQPVRQWPTNLLDAAVAAWSAARKANGAAATLPAEPPLQDGRPVRNLAGTPPQQLRELARYFRSIGVVNQERLRQWALASTFKAES
jgi:hypothetical protein